MLPNLFLYKSVKLEHVKTCIVASTFLHFLHFMLMNGAHRSLEGNRYPISDAQNTVPFTGFSKCLRFTSGDVWVIVHHDEALQPPISSLLEQALLVKQEQPQHLPQSRVIALIE